MNVTSKMRKSILLRFKFLAVSALLLSMAVPVSSSVAQVPFLWGSTASGEFAGLPNPNPGSVFTIDESSGLATLVGPTAIPGGRTGDLPEVSGIDFDPITGTLYGITGSNCTGAQLITIDQTTGAGTVVGPLVGAGFDGTPGPYCTAQGSDGLAFHPDGRLFATGFDGRLGFCCEELLLEIDKKGRVLRVMNAPGLTGLAFDASGVLWASHGAFSDASIFKNGISTIDFETGARTSVLLFAAGNQAKISDLAFGPDGILFASIPSENTLATIDTLTGALIRIGSFGTDVTRMSGLTSVRLQALTVVIGDLIATVMSLNLQKGIENALDAKLGAVIQVLDDVNQNNNVAAFNMLNAFIQNVEIQRGKKLTNDQANQLVAGAQAIIDRLSI